MVSSFFFALDPGPIPPPFEVNSNLPHDLGRPGVPRARPLNRSVALHELGRTPVGREGNLPEEGETCDGDSSLPR